MKPLFQYRHQYDLEADARAREETDITPTGESLTLQGPAEDADLNNVLKRFGIHDNAILPVTHDPRYYGNVDDTMDLRTAIEAVHEAERTFALLPAKIRRRFGESPAQLHDFVMDPDNRQEAIELGLLVATPRLEDMKVPTTEVKTPPTPAA